MNNWIVLCSLSFALSFFLSRIIIRLLGKRLIDIPSDRSSHSLPTPRGGGIAIATTIILVSAGTEIYGSSALPWTPLLLFTLMAILGALDDFMNLSVRVRLLIQFLLSLIAVIICVRELNFQGADAIILSGVCVIALVWQCNLYNFMDGINGIATIQAICVCVIMGIILHQTNNDTAIVKLLVITGMACAGFLYWNFPSARIFMGDTGSLFLGFIFGFAAIKTSIGSIDIAAAWLISMAVFIVDASYTLSIRLLSGQKFYLPHRSHSYQKLALTLNSHTKATSLVCLVNMSWLFPITLLMIKGILNPIVALILAYTPLIVIAIKLKAGRPS